MLVRHATGERLDLILITNLLLVAGGMVLLFAVARKLAGTGLALALLVLLAFSPAVLWMGGSLYSEGLFFFLSSASLALAFRAEEVASRSAYPAIGFALLAFLTRLTGVALVVGLAAWLWSRRRRMELAVYALASVLVIGGWFAYTAIIAPEQSGLSYAPDLAKDLPASTATAGGGILVRVRDNSVSYLTGVLPTEFSLPSVEGTLIDNVIWLALNVLFLAVGLMLLWRRWRAAAGYSILYAGQLLVFPWAINRLLDPVIPLLFLMFLLGANHLARRLPVRVRGPALGVLFALLVFGVVLGARSRLALIGRCDRASPYVSAGCYDAESISIAKASDYIRTNTAPGELVFANRPAGVEFLSGHRGEPSMQLMQVREGDIGKVMRDRKIPHVLLTAQNAFEAGPLAQALLSSCRDLQIEARFPPHALLMTPAVAGTTAPDACTAIGEFTKAYKRNPHLSPP